MPSPFPGMDPFLERPEVFPDLHDSMIFCFREALQACLPAPYYAVIGSYVWIEVANRFVEPDVNVQRPRSTWHNEGSSVAAMATLTSPQSRPVIVTVADKKVREKRRQKLLEIHTRPEGGGEVDDRLVTSIELLSPVNKTPGEEGLKAYQKKQRQVLKSKTNLVEIDLLRAGRHTTAVPLNEAIEKTGAFDYHACIHRFDKPKEYLVYPIQLAERLPEIAVPLLPGEQDVLLDLQLAFDRCYDTGPYRRLIRYTEQIILPPLRTEQEEWAKQVLREKGLVTAS